MEQYTPIRDRETELMRRRFAQAAMQGILANEMFMHGLSQKVENPSAIPAYIAESAVQMADALIEELQH